MKNKTTAIKKIILILPFLEGRGGMETVMTTLIPMIKADGIQIKLFMLGKEKQHYKEWLENIEYKSSMCTHKSKKVRNLVYTIALSRFLHQEKPDFIICTNSLTCLIADFARKICFGHYPLVSWSHNSLININKKSGILRADFHLAIASEIAEQLIQLGTERNSIYTIFNPCKPANRLIPRPTNKHKFAYLGRILFGDEKRLKDILDAFSTIENEFELHIIGDGKDMKITQDYAKQLSIYPKIIWHGWKHEPWEVLHDITAIILASTHEGFGMVLAEAAAHGVYSISSSCPTGPKDIIQNGINGILFKPRDVQALHNILSNIINGETLPDQQLIQSSAERFYPENYYTLFKTSLTSITERWHNQST